MNKKKKVGIFIDRFQPFHKSHKKCILKILEECDTCTVLIRDGFPKRYNPFEYTKRRNSIIKWVNYHNLPVMTKRLQDDDYNLTVFLGRDVGYKLIQLSAEDEDVSSTDIRKKLYDA